MNPLTTVKGAVVTAFVLAIVLSLALTNVAGVPACANCQ